MIYRLTFTLKHKIKNNNPKMDPCGTPYVTLCSPTIGHVNFKATDMLWPLCHRCTILIVPDDIYMQNWLIVTSQ